MKMNVDYEKKIRELEEVGIETDFIIVTGAHGHSLNLTDVIGQQLKSLRPGSLEGHRVYVVDPGAPLKKSFLGDHIITAPVIYANTTDYPMCEMMLRVNKLKDHNMKQKEVGYLIKYQTEILYNELCKQLTPEVRKETAIFDI